tara:strand:- start:4 stop:402 length:399 start_codon:yes stop_codon:yes gene_type:complete
MTITFTIPGKPCAWQRARSNGKIRFDSPEQTRNKSNIASIAFEAMRGRPPLEGALSVEVIATWPWPKSMSKKKREVTPWVTGRPDADNVMKLIGDAINNIVWRDDSQIVYLFVTKKYGEVPSTFICVWELEE